METTQIRVRLGFDYKAETIWFPSDIPARDFLTSNIFESGPMPTPSKFLAGPPLLPSCKLG